MRADIEEIFLKLADELSACRGVGHVTAGWEELDPLPLPVGTAQLEPWLAGFLDDVGLRPVAPEALVPVAREKAEAILTQALARDLTERRETLPEDQARALAQRFLELFGADAAFFTNGEHEPDGTLRRWVALGSTTLDTGILAVDRDQAGLVWIEDEPEDEDEPEPEL